MYLPLYQKVKAGTNLINDAKYEELVKLLSNPLPKGATMTDRNNRRKYQLVGNVAGHCLYRNGLVVTTVEKVFDVILEAHVRLNHARSNSKNKECIKEQLGYYGVPKTAVKCFVETCAVVSSMASHNGTGSLVLFVLTLLYIYVTVRCKHNTEQDSTAATKHDSAKESW
jgi:hypothetical protein